MNISFCFCCGTHNLSVRKTEVRLRLIYPYAEDIPAFRGGQKKLILFEENFHLGNFDLIIIVRNNILYRS